MSCYLLHFNAAVYRFTLIEWLNMKPSQILSVLDGKTKSKETLKQNLTDAFPNKRMMIEQVFSRY